MKILTLDIEFHEKDGWSQAKYLVHGLHDVLWTDSIDEAVAALKKDFIEFEKENNYGNKERVSK